MVYYTVKLCMSTIISRFGGGTIARYICCKGKGKGRRQFSYYHSYDMSKDAHQNCSWEKAHSFNAVAIFLWMASTPRRGDNLGSTSCAIHAMIIQIKWILLMAKLVYLSQYFVICHKHCYTNKRITAWNKPKVHRVEDILYIAYGSFNSLWRTYSSYKAYHNYPYSRFFHSFFVLFSCSLVLQDTTSLDRWNQIIEKQITSLMKF